MYEQWKPDILSPYIATADIDLGEEGAVRIVADRGNLILHANQGKVYLDPEQAREVIKRLEDGLRLAGRYEAGLSEMMPGIVWRQWRNQVLGRVPAGAREVIEEDKLPIPCPICAGTPDEWADGHDPDCKYLSETPEHDTLREATGPDA